MRRVVSKQDALDFFDALERSYEVASEAWSREYDEWREAASDKQRIALLAVSDELAADVLEEAGFPAPELEDLAWAWEVNLKLEHDREERRRRYLAARFLVDEKGEPM